VCGTVKLALIIEDKLSVKERERQATDRLAHQYMHAVHKKADLLQVLSELLQEMAPTQLSDSGGGTKAIIDTKRLSQIASSLRGMSTSLIQTGKDFETKLSPENVNLADVLSWVTGAVMNTYPTIRVTREDFPQVEMYGIRPFIEGAFENLLLNAIEAQQYKGEIGVFCTSTLDSQNQSCVDVYICDNGPGLADEVREKVGKGERITTKGEGRGFGLEIARRSFAECGGEIHPHENTKPGWHGACFRVRVPVRAMER
jgi:signal transduction histidine kinase